jgi:rod shape-determining protein MreC
MLKKRLVLFAVFILLIFGLLTFQSIKGKSRFIDTALYPLTFIERAGTTVIHGIRNAFDTYIMIAGKEEENRRLLGEIQKLEQEKNDLVEARLENERLKKVLKLKTHSRNYVTTAGVFGRDPTNWFQTIWIDKGTESGIEKDMVAVTPLGPVGKVRRVLQNGANIALITDVNSSVAVRLQPSRIEGILQGSGEEKCSLQYISKETEVNIGEKVITSGLDGIYPKGLIIGHVTSVRKEDVEIFQVIEVEPAQDLNSVEDVVILKK